MRHDMSVLPAEELSSVVVEAHAVLPFACLGNQRHRPRIESKITPERDGLCGGISGIGNDAGIAIDQAVNSIIEAPSQTSEYALGINGAGSVSPAGENDLLLIGHTVVVDVLVEDQIRSCPHENPTAITKDRRRKAQAFRKDRGLVESAVSVCILQPGYLSVKLLASLVLISHLVDEQSAVFVERECDRIGDQGFGSDELEAKPLLESKCIQSIRRRHRW